MLRKLALSLAIAGAMSSTTAQALGLGEIQIKSALNEPLRAEIQLLQARQLNPQQVQPRMAGIDEFALAGIEKLRFLTDVQFNVQIRPDGNGVIYLSSAVPVKEPFLNFLVEVNWPSGRLVREYTVLLDPPVYDPTPATVAAQPPKIRSEAMTAAPLPQSQSRPATPSKPVSNIQTRADGKSEVYVDVNDTLWHIAQQNRPSDSISEAQMMLAIQRKNPDAFSNGNVNQLKAGVVLKMPTMEEAKKLTPQQAKEEFWRQTAVWKQSTGKSAKKPQLDSSDKSDVSVKSAAPADPVAESGQLKIVASASESDSAAMADGQSGEMAKADDSELVAKNTQLETDLTAALETVDQIQRENQELTGRVDALAQQMESLQRLLELKDQQLAALQAELDAAKKQQLDAELAAQQAAESGLVPTIMKVLKDFGLYIAAGGAGLLALIAGLIFFLRRRKDKDEEAGSELEQAVADAEADIGDVTEATEDAVTADAESVADADADVPDEAEELVAMSDDVDLDDLEDLTELDLEMDLDDSFAENPLEAPDADPLDETIDDQEFDLGLGDDDLDADLAELDIADVEEAVEPAAVTAAADPADDEFDLDLDMDIDEPFAAAAEQPEVDELSEELAGPEVDDALDAILDEGNDASIDDVLAEIDDDELEFTAEPLAQDTEDDIADLDDVLAEAGGDDLEFTPQALPDDEPEAVAEAVADDSDELEFDLSAAEEDEDLVDLDSLLNDAPPEAPVAAQDESVDIDDLMADLQSADPLPEDEDDSDMVSLDELLGESSAPEAASPVPEHVAVHPEVESLLEEAVAENDEVVLDETAFTGGSAADELEATFSSDLDADLDSELEALLSGDDSALPAGGDESLDGISLLDGADEVETKLDLARAYIDMEDVDGAKDILAEILQEGSDNQKQEANSLLESLV
ncbi:FimV/HubP family polar landmark protein [Aliamphritea hakodatensis]|uniref:FimV/HubP family polar landmark protein n=1 Tax=Aliamphritea hakodatensis TaxID=2895352 RepID=UPI0022FD72B4|nr:FimV/HubP family polar landmark protein [Aliamphritea hakodatensis]